MPLITCPDCGHRCSNVAATCTECGRPIVGSITPPPAEVVRPMIPARPAYGRSVWTQVLMTCSVFFGAVGLLGEISSGKASFGAYVVAILFGIWARIAQANAYHRAQIDAIPPQ